MNALAQQPTLRPFIVFDALPAGCIAHIVTDQRTAPLLRPGDTVVIDTDDCEPTHGDLFAIDYGKSSSSPRRCVVEMGLRRHNRADGGSLDGWWSHPYYRPRSKAEALTWCEQRKPIFCSDGPIDSQSAKGMAYLRDALVGRIVGILEPRFAEPMRQIGEVR